MRSGVSGINAMALKYQRLVAVLLRPQSAGHILGALHDAPALIVEAQDGGHHIAAGSRFQCGGQFFVVADAPGGRPSSAAETRHVGLLLHPRLRRQRSGYVMQVANLISLILCERQRRVLDRHEVHGQTRLRFQRCLQLGRQRFAPLTGPA